MTLLMLAGSVQFLTVKGQFLNGFDLSNSSIPVSQIVRGGPPRDGIPAIDRPHFLPGVFADYLDEDDLIIGLKRNGIARAYPLRIMLWHEIVNDVFAGEALAVTYCPLCGTAVVFEASIGGQDLNFGVSGLLFQSDVLMYDRQTESLWSQLMLRAVTGEQIGKELTIVPSQVLTWAAWIKKHPTTEVLSTDTGFDRDYQRNPYAFYENSQEIWFQVPLRRHEFENKDLVLGVLVDGLAKAYAIRTMDSAGQAGSFHDEVNQVPLVISYDPDGREANIRHRETGEPFPFIQSFWFAWQAFYPDTEVWAPLQLSVDPERRLHLSGERGKDYLIERTHDFERWSEAHRVHLTESTLTLDASTAGHETEFYRATRIP